MTYLNVDELATGVEALAQTYPDFCDLIRLPERSVENREIVGLSIGNTRGDERPTAIFIGGVHAREWIPPDAVLYCAADLLEARKTGTGLRYGGASFTTDDIETIFRNLQLVFLPCANPDGRAYSQTTEPLWRKNRSVNPLAGGGVCRGVDLNRNFDVAWDFRTKFAPNSVSASDNPCDPQIYVGPSPASEPETRNIVWLLDHFAQTQWYLDIHSAIPAVFHGWGLDENQSAEPGLNFLNADHDGARGLPGDTYGEFIEADDAVELERLSTLMAREIEKVRGDRYAVGQAYSLYATSGASDDYALSRHHTDPTKSKVLGFTMECGHEFQPNYDEGSEVMREVAAALVGFAKDRAEASDLVQEATSV
ncbi:M14 family metallopeptidase [Ruegeria sp. HKCCD8929]|uniref:M14 family metallopeptidase n=1 Tax=Ruegeria sp. HKCCD8929 TaxID=2683006 RepID=UPI001488FE4F|nr:M14 family metallopeptidase [Ruegeria sp. HKCCD8929]